MIDREKRMIFRGVCTALVTPMKEAGEIDFDSFEKMCIRQIEGGADALLFCGTTGEAPTLTEEEISLIYKFAHQTVGGAVPVILGCGSNSHKKTMHMAEMAAKWADALLIVAPYYNRGTSEGIIRSMNEVFELAVPTFLYNIPQRTGVDVSIDVVKTLSEERWFYGIKECAGVGRIAKLCEECPQISVYSGNDSELLPSLSVGAEGLFSVVSNLYPEKVKKICELFFCGKWEESLYCYRQISKITELLFCETNPVPVKYALCEMELCENNLRLPLFPLDVIKSEKIVKEMKKIG